MQLVEQHVINRDDPRWKKIDEAAFASKNLYNAANYIVRQAFIFEYVYLDNVKVFHLIKHTPAYKALPAKVSNLVLDQLHKNWKSYFAAVRAYNAEGIGTLVIGKNPGWKQDPTMSRKNAQEFVQIPHARFICMLSYKAQLVGIQIIVSEESYTSKASFLDLDDIPTYGKEEDEPVLSGKRTKRGMYKSSTGRKINSDVNGSYNIMRKVVPNVFTDNGIEGAAVHPIRLAV